MRLIDAEVLERKMEAILKELPNGGYHYQNWLCVVNDTPTVEAVPVVKCKDCVFEKSECPMLFVTREDDYCSYGERRREV